MPISRLLKISFYINIIVQHTHTFFGCEVGLSGSHEKKCVARSKPWAHEFEERNEMNEMGSFLGNPDY